MHRIYTSFLLLLIWYGFAKAQCVTNVDFNTWNQAGWIANGNWTPQGGGTSVFQSVNGNPTFFVSPFDLMNVRVTGTFRTTASDDDYMGFVFCFLNPMGQSDNFDTWLFDWKKGNQVSGSYTGQAGKSLCRVNGVIPASGYAQTFWGHQNTPAFTVHQNDFPGPGWVQNFNHSFELVLSFTRAIIYIDGQLVFDHSDCYVPGRFGFYNYSQQNCTYSNFQYSLDVDFTVVDSAVCLGNETEFRFFDPCAGLNFNFSQYQSVTWNFGDGNVQTINNPSLSDINATHTYTQPGNYSATLTVVDVQGCSASATRQVTILEKVNADFNAPSVCEGNTSQFTDTSTGNPTAWAWNLGDGNTSSVQSPANTYANDGIYNATLIANNANNCPDTATKTVTVYPSVVSSFNASDVCFPNSVSFSNLSSGPVTGYQWNFGDATQSTQASPSHSYTTAGTYNVSLMVSSNDGCADTSTQTVTVFPKPSAQFSATSVCKGGTTLFTDNSTVSTGSIASYLWNFDDGNTAAQQHPANLYASDGTYQVTEIVVTDNGCADTLTQSVVVYADITASFSVTDVCMPQPAVFTSQIAGPSATYHWDFGDGTFASQPNASHAYASHGTYQVVFTVASNDGCADTVTQQMNVFAKPLADFSVNNVCANTISVFTNNSTLASGNITGYTWSLGDGNFSVQQSPQHTYTSAGAYQVTLVVASDNNCYDTVFATTVVNPNPVAAFTTGAVCLNNTTAFSNNSSITSGNIAQYFWDFGDGQISNQQQPSHVYAAYGTYHVSLLTVSDSSCVDSVSISVTVYDKPVAAFNVTEECFGAATGFTDLSTIAAGNIAQWNYSLGDGNTSVQQHPTYTYTSHGNFNAVLIVTSDNGCSDTAYQTVTVNPLPQVSFTAPDVCFGFTTVFANISSIPLGNITTWNWTFGNGNFSSSQQTSQTYATPGVYNVRLVATSDKGCMDSSSANSTVFELPIISTTSTPACFEDNNGTVEATVTNGTAPYTYFWSSNAVTPQVQDLYANTYTLTVTDANNCTATATETVLQPPIPLTVTANPTPAAIEIGEILNMNLQNSYNDANAVYSISPAYGLSCYSCEQFEAFPYHTMQYTVHVTDALGCPGTGTFIITVNEALPVFIPNVFTPNGDGQNDTWGVFSRGVKYINLQVFNRWGEKVFETDNLNNFWDGTFLGKPADPGVYVYEGRIVFLSDESRPVKGTVTLLK